jgi:gliding motility-associated-like protein
LQIKSSEWFDFSFSTFTDYAPARRFYAPTIFNPESKNAENIGYKIFPAFPILDFQMYIYNKQGNLIYYSSDANETWDGTFRGKKLNPEVYFWQVRASIDACGHPVPFNKTGSVMLMRN